MVFLHFYYHLQITSFWVQGPGGALIPLDSLPHALRIRLSLLTTILPPQSICLNPMWPRYNLQGIFDASKKIITVTCNPDPCAEFYELEWIYVDDYTSDSTLPNTRLPDQLFYTFYQQAMRVRV